MPTFQLVTANKTKLLGDYLNREEVLKLRIFKEHPELIHYLQEVQPAKPIMLTTRPERKSLRSNRWRILFPTLSNDLTLYYTRAEAEQFMLNTLTFPEHCKLLRVPKYAYHKSDGPIISEEGELT